MASFRGLGRRVLAAAMLALLALPAAAAEKFSFGVMSDTQWKANLDGKNPATVAVGIIEQLNAEFIAHGVKFVIQVGDLGDTFNSTTPSLQTRAAAAKALFDAGIGFLPLRGNHEGSQAAALQFQKSFPQTQGTGLSSPTSPAGLAGLTYAFDYGDARFVLLDQFTRTDGSGTVASVNVVDQLPWIETTLTTNPAQHSFVFAHKGLITENHKDVLFGSNPSSNPGAQDAFFAALQKAGTRYFFGGHDHMHNRALVVSPDRSAAVQDITASSNSYKFYIPCGPTNPEGCLIQNDLQYDVPPRETPLSQELFTVGYYIVTVDGPRVTVDHYAAPNGCDGDCNLTATPTLAGKFTKRETFGYSLNGREFLVGPGESYAVVQDESDGTSAAILDGKNDSAAAVFDGRLTSHVVNTGWSPRECGAGGSTLHLWGMASAMGSDRTDVHALTMTFDPRFLRAEAIGNGGFGLLAKDEAGLWVNAVSLDSSGTPTYVKGPYQPGYALGTYGVDPDTKTAWAVIDYTNAEFKVSNFEPTKNCR